MVLGLGTILGIGSGIAGLIGDSKKNKRAKEQLRIDRDIANEQIDLSNYLEEIARGLMGQNSAIRDAYDGVTGYDPVTGTWGSAMRPGERAVQDASDQEELARNTIDQQMRRQALQEAEGRRGRAGVEADQSMRDLSLFRQGVGAADPTSIASSLRLGREAAVNAGFDDAARAATTLQARTGSSSIADAIADIGRQRGRAIAETRGTPDVEGLTLADQLNTNRLNNLSGRYGMYTGVANNVYDAAFNPSTAADDAFNRSATVQGLDLSRIGTALGGVGTAISGLGSAGSTGRAGYQTAEQNRVTSPFGSFLSGLSGVLGAGK